MSVLANIKSVYLIGIGGIGMSALARFFAQRGLVVAGYDRTPSALTESLQGEGIAVSFKDGMQEVPSAFTKKEETLVIYTPAIPAAHQQLNHFRDNGFLLKKRAEVLGMLSEGHRTLAVAGTHGKTTTSSILAHLLRSSSLDCNAFLGGISADYGTNFLSSTTSDLLVAEADEYDRSFLRLSPSLAIITSVDADHLDIYGTADEMVLSFKAFAAKVEQDGYLIHRVGLPFTDADTRAKRLTYAIDDAADFRAVNVRVEQGKFTFDLHLPQGVVWKNLALGIPGRHNVENAVAAIAIAHSVGATEAEIRPALSAFKGVQRRFEVHVNTPTAVYVDDYAHHPAELDACISAARELFPKRRLTGIFQPHLFSRTRDHLEGFAKSLSQLDEVLLMEIYPARELPIEGVTSSALLRLITAEKKTLVQKEEVIPYLQRHRPDVLLTLGAGDIDRLVGPIAELLSPSKTLG